MATAPGTIASNSAGSSAGREPTRVESPGVDEFEQHPVGAVSGPGIARAESVDEFASLLSVPAVANCSTNSSLDVHFATSNFAF